VVLDPDIAKAFPDSASVNEALRVVLKAGRTARRLTTRSSGPGKFVGRSGAPKKWCAPLQQTQRGRPLNSVVRQRIVPITHKEAGRTSVRRRAVTFDDVREVAHTLPGVEDGTSYGTPALKVRGKLFVRLHQNRDCFVLRSGILDRHILIQAQPEVFFITDHYLDYPWILVRFSTIPRNALPELLERAWRLVAPKTLLAKREVNQ